MLRIAYSIRKLTPTDLSLARQLLEGWAREDGREPASLPVDDYLRDRLAREGFHVWVALHDGQAVGGLTAYELPMFGREEREFFLYEIGVREDHRRRGVARALIEELKATARKKGIRVIFVGTSLDNEAAQQLYAATGGVREVAPWFTYRL